MGETKSEISLAELEIELDDEITLVGEIGTIWVEPVSCKLCNDEDDDNKSTLEFMIITGDDDELCINVLEGEMERLGVGAWLVIIKLESSIISLACNAITLSVLFVTPEASVSVLILLCTILVDGCSVSVVCVGWTRLV